MPIGAVIGGAATLGGAALTSGAASDAAAAQQQAEQEQLAFQKQVYGNAQTNLNPDISTGNNAGSALAGLLGTGGDPAASQTAFNNYLNSTNYKFQLGQGEQGIEYANAPAFSSGATAKALNNYAQGQAGSALSGYESLLSGQQGLGVNAAAALNNVGTTISSQNSASTNAAASATGNADIASGNAYSNALSTLGKSLQSGSSFGGSSVSGILGSLFGGGTGGQSSLAGSDVAGLY